jgi:hypothetical protein
MYRERGCIYAMVSLGFMVLLCYHCSGNPSADFHTKRWLNHTARIFGITTLITKLTYTIQINRRENVFPLRILMCWDCIGIESWLTMVRDGFNE